MSREGKSDHGPAEERPMLKGNDMIHAYVLRGEWGHSE